MLVSVYSSSQRLKNIVLVVLGIGGRYADYGNLL